MKYQCFLSALLFLALSTTALRADHGYPAPTDVIKAYFAAVDAGNAAETEKVLADGLQASAPFLPQAVDKKGWIGIVQSLKTAFPDMRHEVVDAIESGFKVAVRGIVSGQNNGVFMGNPPTGNRINFPFNTVFELNAAWKITAIYVQFDQKTMETQLTAGLPDPVAAAQATVRAMLAATDAGDVEKFMSYCSANSIHYFQGTSASGEDLKKRIAAFKTGFPDIKRGVDELIVSGNTVVARGVVSGTNTGPFGGNPPTGKSVKVSWIGIYKLDAAGKVSEGRVEFDRASVEKQLKSEQATVKGG